MKSVSFTKKPIIVTLFISLMACLPAIVGTTQEIDTQSAAAEPVATKKTADATTEKAAAEPASKPEGTAVAVKDDYYDPNWKPKPIVKEVWKLGPPLVDKPENLVRLHPKNPIWIDKKAKEMIIQGVVCARQAQLELFACLRDSKEHEAIVTCEVEAYTAYVGLTAIGAKKGTNVKFRPVYQAATGTEIEIIVKWKDKKGKVQECPAQDWIYNMQTKKAMVHPWVFAGSRFIKDEEGRNFFLAEDGDFVCVTNFGTALLDLPVKSSTQAAQLLYEAYTDRIPPVKTPVTLIFRPKTKKEVAKK